MIEFLVGALLTHLTIVSVSIYLHRALAHKAITLHPTLQHLVRLYLWLGTGIVSETWVGVHRKHHAYTDAPGDPHSPRISGLLKVLSTGTLLYLKSGSNANDMQRYARGCPNDFLQRNLYRPYPYLGLPFFASILIWMFGLPGALIFVVNFIWIPFWGAGVVNGIGHYFGYRNFKTPDDSRNIIPIGIIMAGEELHNNHHQNPSSAKFSSRWFEIDIGWLWIQGLSKLRLIHVHNSRL